MKTKIPFYLVVFLFSIFFLTGCTNQENVEISKGLVKEGEELYQEREYKAATEKFSEALEKYPGNIDAYLGLTSIFLDKGYFDEMEKLVQEASLRVNREDAAGIYTMIGRKYYEIGNFDNSQKMYEAALVREKSFEKAKIGLAEVHIQKGELDNAREALKGDSKEAKYLLLNSYLSLDNWDEGSKKISDVDLNGVNDEKLKEKISNLREIYTLDDEDALYKNTSLAGEYVNSGYPFLAITLLNDYADAIGEYGDAQYFLGRAYLDYGDYEKAIERLNQAILLDIDDVNVYVNLARAYLVSQNVEQSLDTYKTAIGIVESEDSAHIVQEYVNVLVENNMINVAKNFIIDLLKEEDSFTLNLILADIYYQQQDLKNMEEILDKLEKESNLNQGETRDLTRYRLLCIMEDIKDIDELESLIERFSVFDRYNPEIFLFKGQLLLYQEENLKAQEALERAIELDLEGDVADQANKLLATIN